LIFFIINEIECKLSFSKKPVLYLITSKPYPPTPTGEAKKINIRREFVG